MNVFKYTKIDIVRLKAQLIGMGVFVLIAAMFMHSSQSLVSGLGYLAFAAVIMGAAAFSMDQKNETGFVNLLPGTDRERIAGKFITGYVFLIIGMALGTVCALVMAEIYNISATNLPECLIILTGIALIFMAIQNVIFYMAGKSNSQQLNNIIHMIPAFVMWIGMAVLEKLMTEEEFVNKIVWVTDNFLQFSVIVLVIGIILNIIGIFVSEKIVSKKDFG